MRRILSPEDLEKKRKRTVAILSIIMLALLVLSSLSYAIFSGPGFGTNIQDNNQPGTLSIQYQGVGINLVSTEQEINTVPVNITKTPQDYIGKAIYIDSQNQGILAELGAAFKSFSPNIQQACLGQCPEDFPEKNCSDNLIVWRESAENKVYQQDNCIFIEGDIRAADSFIYNLFTIQ